MENINISFAPDTSAVGEKRISDIENYLALLSERIRFCFENIGEEQAAKKAGGEDNKLILSALSDGVGEFTNTDKNCEIFNDYSENRAEAYYSHAEGSKTSATAPYSHAEGYKTVARELASHSEGLDSIASGQAAHAEGECCEAGGRGSHAGGYHTKAYDTGMCSVGRCNKTVYNALFVVGNGVVRGEEEYPSDALVVDNAGNLHIAGRMLADGGVEIDLGEYLRSDEIADWAKAAVKPEYTASEVGAAAESHNHTVANITDMPDWAKATAKPEYTASEVGAAAESHDHTVADITDMPDWTKSATKPEYTASEVGAATVADIKAAVDGIEIGGSNLLLNTKSFSSATSTSLSGALLSGSASLTDEKYRGLSVRGGAVAESQSVVCRYGFKDFDLGETFTFSFFARGNVPELRVYFYGETGYVQVAKCTNSQGEANTNTDGRCSFSVSDSWKKYRVTWTLKQAGDTSIAKWILIRTFNSTIGQEIYVCGCKLEKGNKATDWSPAADDVLSLEERVSALEAAILSGGEG